MNKKLKRDMLQILLCGALYAAAILFSPEGALRLAVFLIPYVLIGWDVLYTAARNLLRGQMFDENFLMAVATLGALAIGEYPEAVAVMLFYKTGTLFENYAVGKSRRSIAELMDIRPDYANIETNGTVQKADPESVAVGDIIVIYPGERIPLDGIVTEGSSCLNTAALTGEAMPKDVQPGDAVISGCVNVTGLLRVRVTSEYAQSTVSRILELVENSTMNKARTESFITRFAAFYTPCVVICAVLLAVLPPLLTQGDFAQWLHRALIFLVVSCPCALVISVPLSFFGGIGGASRRGILIKGSNFMETLAKVHTVVFDKTGTLTEGTFSVGEIHSIGISAQELLKIAAAAESHSHHPIAVSLRKAVGEVLPCDICNVREIPGKGVCATVNGKQVYAGNTLHMADIGINLHNIALPEKQGTVVHVCIDEAYAGYIVITDTIKPNAAATLKQLAKYGIKKSVMLTGDNCTDAREVADRLGIDEFYAELLPADKVLWVERLLKEKKEKGALLFVGDGVNDAPVLSLADVGIAMGALGSDAAIEAADVVLMDDNLEKLTDAVRISRKTLKLAYQNIIFALAVKLLVLILGAAGITGMWEAVFADVGVSVIAILNAMRALKIH